MAAYKEGLRLEREVGARTALDAGLGPRAGVHLHFVPSLSVFVAIGLGRGNARLLWYLPEQNVIKEQIKLCFQ